MSVHLRFAKKKIRTVCGKRCHEEDIQTVATDQCSFTLAQKALGKDDFTKDSGGTSGSPDTRNITLYVWGKGRQDYAGTDV